MAAEMTVVTERTIGSHSFRAGSCRWCEISARNYMTIRKQNFAFSRVVQVGFEPSLEKNKKHSTTKTSGNKSRNESAADV